MGQPPLIKPYVAGEVTWNGDLDQTGGVGVFGLYKDLVLPVSGALGLSAEGYFGGAGSEWDGGGRFFVTSRLLFLNLGVDYNAQLDRADFIVGWTPYFRRGGLFGRGGNFRIEWIPTRGHSFNVGFQIPLEPHMGQTRPRKTEVTLPEPPESATATLPTASYEALEDLRHAGLFLIVNANLFNDDDDASYFKAMGEVPGDGPGGEGRLQTRPTPGTPTATRSSPRAGTITRPWTGPSPLPWAPTVGSRWPTWPERSCWTTCCFPTTG